MSAEIDQLLCNYTSSEIYNIYMACREKIGNAGQWIYSPQYALESVGPIKHLVDFDVRGKRLCEIGCGAQNPAAAAAILFLNGASHVSCFDYADMICPRRSSLALFDTLVACIDYSEKFCFSGIELSDFLARAGRFDFPNLLAGNLFERIKNTDIRYEVADVYDLNEQRYRDFDLTYSRAVLEHLPDLEMACKIMSSITRPGGRGVHVVDYVDHRFYKDPLNYHRWSFLEEGDLYQLGTPGADRSNRLRPSEVSFCFQAAGFSVNCPAAVREAIQLEFFDRFSEKFKKFPLPELEICLEVLELVKNG